MGLTVCPAAVVAALVEVVWENLVQLRLHLPTRLVGGFLETFGAKTLAASVEDGLQRLKRAYERRYQQAQTAGKEMICSPASCA